MSGDKNEILYAEFGVNYNNEPAQFKKVNYIFLVDGVPPPKKKKWTMVQCPKFLKNSL